tara:strand:- start:11450 stop:12349 length:900 start_codon:yes stop_codon:yes gene_type:complete
MSITAIILTFNESIHLERCILSIKRVADRILVVDSFSQDDTKEIALKNSLEYYEHVFVNHSEQLKWALSLLDENTEWVLRIDADEYLTDDLVNEIRAKIPQVEKHIKGIYIPRSIVFQGRLIKHGGVYSKLIIRLFRFGYANVDNRWMDEHILVNGKTMDFKNQLIDNNLQPLTWWINKHNSYSSKEAFQIFNDKYNVYANDEKSKEIHRQNNYYSYKLKRKIYSSIPFQFRSIIYFFYRYFILLGFLDGAEGFAFHFLQAFWYRYLVDLKYNEISKLSKKTNLCKLELIQDVLKIKIK